LIGTPAFNYGGTLTRRPRYRYYQSCRTSSQPDLRHVFDCGRKARTLLLKFSTIAAWNRALSAMRPS